MEEVQVRNPLGKSDHTVLLFEFICYVESTDQKSRYLYNKGDYELMKEELKNSGWSNISVDTDIQHIWKVFEKDITNFTDRYIPKSKPNQVKKAKQPWFSKDVIQAVRNKHYEWNRYQKDPIVANWDSYIKVRNSTTKKIRQAKKAMKRI